MATNDRQAPGGPQSAPYRTVSDYVYIQLRRRIISGELAPGTRIDQDAEASRLNVSRMPVREALSRLASEGLVIILPHRGAQVRPLSEEDLQDLWILRITLESMAGRLGAENLTDDELRMMHELVPKMNKVVECNDPDAWLDVDSTFHSLLYEAAGHARLVNFIQMLREEASRYRRIGLAFPGELKLSLHEHHEILEACDRRDGEAVERIIRKEVGRSRDKLLVALREQLG